MKVGLLEYLAKENGCEFLSDLHRQEDHWKLYRLLWELREEDYSLKEWNEAISYVLGSSFGCQDYASARKRFLMETKK